MTARCCLYLSFLTLLFFSSCQPEAPEFIPDVSDIQVDLNIQRFEQALFELDTASVEESLARLEEQYPEFSAVFFQYVLGSKNPDIAPEGHLAYMEGFLQHQGLRHLYDTTMVVFPQLDEIEDELRQAMRFYKYYFPMAELPDFTTFISEYSFAAFVYPENGVGIGLDFFLGEDYPYWQYNPQNPNFSDYLVRTYNKEHLVAKALQPLVEDHVGPAPGNRLLDLIIHNGKKLYIRDLLLPYAPDTVLLEMTPAQVDWLKENEFNIWTHFITEDLLYSSEFQKTRKLVDYSPSGPTDMPPEAPGRTGNWIGYQIVKRYMRSHPDKGIQDLINLRDAQQILDQSKYRPRR